jgi:hypothetical protein
LLLFLHQNNFSPNEFWKKIDEFPTSLRLRPDFIMLMVCVREKGRVKRPSVLERVCRDGRIGKHRNRKGEAV